MHRLRKPLILACACAVALLLALRGPGPGPQAQPSFPPRARRPTTWGSSPSSPRPCST